jgi:hypothetical protein
MDNPFAFIYSDGVYIYNVAKAIKKLAARDDFGAPQHKSLARILSGLERLPYCTPGLDVHIVVNYLAEDTGDRDWCGLHLDSKQFLTFSGSYTAEPGGGETFDGPEFKVTPDTRSSIDPRELAWPLMFAELADIGEIKIEDHSAEDLPITSAIPKRSGWNLLAK